MMFRSRMISAAGPAALLWAAAWSPALGDEPAPPAPQARFVQIRPIGDRFVVDVEAPPTSAAPRTSQLRIAAEIKSGRLPRSEPIAWQLDEIATAEAAPLAAPAAGSEGAAATPSQPAPNAAEPQTISGEPEGAAPILPAPLQFTESDIQSAETPSDAPAGPRLSEPQGDASPAPAAAPANAPPVTPEIEAPAPEVQPINPPPGNRRIAGPASPRRLAVLQAPSPALGAVERQAESHVVRGFDLGAKGSLFAAREEFLAALGVLVNALDAAGNSTFHASALAAGLAALDEADDFLPGRSVTAGPRSVFDVAARHDTPLFHDKSAASVPPLVAVQRYYTYAQQQLSAAVEAQAVGSRALYGLGKTYSALARDMETTVRGADSKAVVWHQAALMADSENYAAANDLGVLLARWGKLVEARDLLQHSLSLAPRVETWQNLASVHRALGEDGLAQAAVQEAAALRAMHPTAHAGPYRIQWVSPDAFGRASPAPGLARQPRTQAH